MVRGTSNQSILLQVNNQKGNIPILTGIIFFIILIGGATLYLVTNKNNFTKSPTSKLNPSPSIKKVVQTNSPKPTPTSTKLSILLEKYKDYSVKNGNVYNKNELVSNSKSFENNTMKVMFLYPKNLYFKAGMEPKAVYRRDPGLLIAMDNTITQKDYTDYNIDCRIDPTPDGICAEGIAPWLDISIREAPEIQDFNDPESENIGKFKSISRQAVNLDGSYANSFSILFPSGGKNFIINIKSTTIISQNEDYIYAIWLLLNSFKSY